MKKNLYVFAFLHIMLLTSQISAQNMQIVSLTPERNQNNVSQSANIIIEFDQSINSASLNENTVIVRGSQSGKLSGVFSGGGSTTITFNPDNNFRLGEIISFTITTALQSNGGMTLARGHTYSFTTVSGPPPGTPIALTQRSISAASSGGRDIKALDFDGDGDLDILASNEGVPEQIILFENDGDMNFCGFNTGGNFRNVEVYDIDGDGDYDNFGATGAFDTELNWFENEGTFPFTERFISSEDPWTIAGGDLDSDGDIDVIAAVILPNRLLWFANDGAGNFSPAVSIPTSFGGGSDSYFYIRDINSDGAMDILAFHRDDFNLVWYQNNGSQSFTEHLIVNSSDRSRLASADIDGDGDIDIVRVSVENFPTSPISWFENNGSESFTEHPITSSSTGRIYSVSITDLDGDQDMDILAGGYWFENDGSENFTERIINGGFKSGDNYYANGINYADLDEDGDMDILSVGLYTIAWQENSRFMDVTATAPTNSEVSASLNSNIIITFDQSIDFSTVNSNHIRVVSQSLGLIPGSFSGNGTNTITFDPASDFPAGDNIEVSINERVLSTSGHSLAVTYGFSFQTKTFTDEFPDFIANTVYTHSSNVSGMAIADIDGDGDLDLVSCSFSELLWHNNDGSGNFTTIPISTTGLPVGVFAFDQNGDGHTDIWIDNDGFASSMIYINDGSQNFTESTIAGSLVLKQLTDVNNDGDIDLLFLTNINNWIVWSDSRCEGYGGLGTIPRLSTRDVKAGDIDNDGDNDFISASSLGPVYYNNNDYFNFSNISIDDNNTSSVYLADLDNDGDLDPVFTENFSAIVWYENILMGDSAAFGPRQEIAQLNMDPRDVIAVDIDGDSDADIAAVSRNDDKVVWYENRLNESSADFGPEQLVVSSADGPIMIQSADIDGDGDMDLITISDNDDKLIWFENTGRTVDIKENNTNLPLEFGLHQNYPNPFNPTTSINYSIPQHNHVLLKVYDMLGNRVATLINEEKERGIYSVTFDASGLASGIYFYRIQAGFFNYIRKMILIK